MPKRQASVSDDANWSDAFVKILEQRRSDEGTKKVCRGKRLDVLPGRSVVVNTGNQNNNNNQDADDSSEFSSKSYDQVGETSNQVDNTQDDSSESSSESDASPVDNTSCNQDDTLDITPIYCAGQYALIKFASQNIDKKYIGKIIEKFDEELYVDFMRKKTDVKSSIYFVYPDVRDRCIVPKQDVVRILNDPVKVQRGRFTFEDLSFFNNVY